jgi:hypothetical protein
MTRLRGMRRGAASFLIFVVAIAQGFSLCACRAGQLMGPGDGHVYASECGDAQGDGGGGCEWGELASNEFCDSHLQVKKLTGGSSWFALEALASADVVPWATPGAGLCACGADSPDGDVGLLARSLPLLI